MSQIGGGEMRSKLTGGEILSAHGYQDGGCWHGLLPELVIFRLVVPPLQSGVVGSYRILGVWFPSHLQLEGTGRI
jgi:hypothetical protein